MSERQRGGIGSPGSRRRRRRRVLAVPEEIFEGRCNCRVDGRRERGLLADEDGGEARDAERQRDAAGGVAISKTMTTVETARVTPLANGVRPDEGLIFGCGNHHASACAASGVPRGRTARRRRRQNVRGAASSLSSSASPYLRRGSGGRRGGASRRRLRSYKRAVEVVARAGTTSHRRPMAAPATNTGEEEADGPMGSETQSVVATNSKSTGEHELRGEWPLSRGVVVVVDGVAAPVRGGGPRRRQSTASSTAFAAAELPVDVTMSHPSRAVTFPSAVLHS